MSRLTTRSRARATLARLALCAGTSLCTLPALATTMSHTLEQPTRATQQYNVNKKQLAAGGYDVVAYFPEGGSKPVKGLARFEHTDRGHTYRFSTQQNLERFKQNPDAYIPAHGGWCSWAMAEDGTKVEVDPKSYIIDDGRLFLFYKDIFTDTRAKFEKNRASNITRADTAWKKLSGEPPIKPAPPTPAPTPAPLASELDAQREQFNQTAPEPLKETFEEGVRRVSQDQVMETALKVGAKAPDFTLTDATGAPVNLATLLADGPVILTWYRGGWCPYCNIQLRAYQDALPQFTALGAQLVALSPELPDNSLSTKEKNNLAFTVLSDTGSAVARAYGVSYRLPDSLIDAFKGRLDIPAANGDDSWELPLGVTYVIATDGTIAYAYLNADYRQRAEPSEIIAALKALP